MSFLDLTAAVTLTAPTGVDGRGQAAILNGSTAAGDYVGSLFDASGGPSVRESTEDRTEAHGGVHGDFYHGRFELSLEVTLAPASTWALSNVRRDKLFRATNAMHSDGTMGWTEDGVAWQINYRRQQRPNGPNKDKLVVVTLVSADYAILTPAYTTPAAPTSGMTPVGNVGALPKFTFTTASGTGTVIINRTTPSPTESITLNVGGTDGLAASTATTVDFYDRSIVQGSTDKRSALVWPATWWEMAPGTANTLSITGTNSVTSKLVSWRSARTV